jgi:hypothetical protein
MPTSLWPDFKSMTPPRGMREMLYEMAGDIDVQTGGKIKFYVDTVGISDVARSRSMGVQSVRYNGYLRVPSTGYSHLLFRVTTPAPGPWPATTETPEGDTLPQSSNEGDLREVIRQVLQRERTQEVVLLLLGTASASNSSSPPPSSGN